MKRLTPGAILAAVMLFSGLAIQSNAQYRAIGEDGIAASPKIRQFLNERKMAPKAVQAQTQTVSKRDAGYKAIGVDGIAASPKVRQFLAQRKTSAGAPADAAQVASTRDAGYRPIGEDGIAASPKARQRLDEHKPIFQIAPLK